MEQISNNFKKIFLLTFTKELIKHSEKKDIQRLQNIIEQKENKKREESLQIPSIKEISQIPITEKIPLPQKINEPVQFPKSKILPRKIRRTPLLIPEPKLPEHLQYLRPVSAGDARIDLFKINPLINDTAVMIIEGNPDEKVRVTGTMGTKPTGIFLTKEDIDNIINKFSGASKIPVNEGIYRVAVGNLNLSAIISKNIGSRFIIKKIISSK
jgi:hypothetical protein